MKQAVQLLSPVERAILMAQAAATSKVERKWRKRYDDVISEFDAHVFRKAFETGELDFGAVDFSETVARQAFQVSEHGEQEAQSVERSLGLAKAPPKIRIPRKFADLRVLYDRYRKTGKLPPHQRDIADRLKKYYIQRCKSVWKKYSEDFRSGNEFDLKKTKAIIERHGDMARARAEMISNTETTNYYNASRRAVYDRSSDVTHYLFIAIRDAATTKWCRSRAGLVFTKGTALCDQNTPACHWNCRSEMLPLTAQNPRHQRLIENQSLRAENNYLVPLPKGWRSAG